MQQVNTSALKVFKTAVFLIGLVSFCLLTGMRTNTDTSNLNASHLGNKKYKKLAIGDKHSGGIIFYLDKTGEHGLVVSAKDISTSAKWGYLDSAVNANAKAVGSGRLNSSKICDLIIEPGIAARLCTSFESGKFKNWYLPSLDELNLIYTNLKLQNLGDLSNAMYWCSSETDFNNAWAQNFETGFAIERHVNTPCHVRAINEF